MLPRRLALLLALTLIWPTYQAVNAQRDINAEETVVVTFVAMRREAGLPPLARAEGSLFARAACYAAERGTTDKVWVENTNYAAMIYSTSRPENAEALTQLATQNWGADRRFVIGACQANTPAFPAGRYWVAAGVLGGASEQAVADLLGGGLSGTAGVRESE